MRATCVASHENISRPLTSWSYVFLIESRSFAELECGAEVDDDRRKPMHDE
jgi:hypothetical protein